MYHHHFDHEALLRYWRTHWLNPSAANRSLSCPACDHHLSLNGEAPTADLYQMHFALGCGACQSQYHDNLPLHPGALRHQRVSQAIEGDPLHADTSPQILNDYEPFKTGHIEQLAHSDPEYLAPRDWYRCAHAIYQHGTELTPTSLAATRLLIDRQARSGISYQVDPVLLRACLDSPRQDAIEEMAHCSGLFFLRRGLVSGPDQSDITFIAYAVVEAGVHRYQLRPGSYVNPAPQLLLWAGDLERPEMVFAAWNLGLSLSRLHSHPDGSPLSTTEGKLYRKLIHLICTFNRFLRNNKTVMTRVKHYGDVVEPMRLGLFPLPKSKLEKKQERLGRVPWARYLDVLHYLNPQRLYSARQVAEEAWCRGFAKPSGKSRNAWLVNSVDCLGRLVKKMGFPERGDGTQIGANHRMVRCWFGSRWQAVWLDKIRSSQKSSIHISGGTVAVGL